MYLSNHLKIINNQVLGALNITTLRKSEPEFENISLNKYRTLKMNTPHTMARPYDINVWGKQENLLQKILI